jgi:murein DD-endopeptidase MepM/ murein hydrolase activator NlpD
MEVIEAPIRIEKRQIRRGDTLYGIFSDFGLPESQILALSQSRIEGIDPTRLVAGRSYRVYLQEDRIVEYRYEPDGERIVRVRFSDDGPDLTVEPIPYRVEKVTLHGSIIDSLFGAVDSMGEKPSLAMDIADIFAWQVDFFRDLRKGDSFTVLVEKYYREGEFVRYGRILAARFINDGREHQAYIFKTSSGLTDYFDENGGSLRKQFLKAPLRFRRISSGFSTRRLHPVTRKVVPHLGVDYAAPTGTPVMAIGDGKVILRKRDTVNGRMIKIRHNSVYASAYLHLNGFAAGIRVGSTVRQGQIIGYVGMTGRATGPHLHFAMYRDGKYVDPRRINVPRAGSVAKIDRDTFMARVDGLASFLRAEPGNLTASGTRE